MYKYYSSRPALTEATVESIPFNRLAEIYASRITPENTRPNIAEQIEQFAKDYRLKVRAEWVFPQLLAKFATLPLVKNESGKYSGAALFREIRSRGDWLSGAYLLTMHDSRGPFIDGQTSSKYRNYSALVPLIMSAFKKMHNIKYSEWDPKEISSITHPSLAKAMLFKDVPQLSNDEALAERIAAIGDNNPLTTYRMYPKGKSQLIGLPKLVQFMVCQTWCAHPSNRTEYMILNPLDWDSMPEPLIDTHLTSPSYNDIPW